MSDLDRYMLLPWTIKPSVRTDDGTYHVLNIEELPGFIVTGETREEAETEFWLALEDFISSYLDDGEQPPVPAGWQDPVDDEDVAVVVRPHQWKGPEGKQDTFRTGSLGAGVPTRFQRSGRGSRGPQTEQSSHV